MAGRPTLDARAALAVLLTVALLALIYLCSQTRAVRASSRSNLLGEAADSQQKALIEHIYQKQRKQAETDLTALQPWDFETSIALHDEPGYPRRFIWDFFRADYNCFLRERVGQNQRDGDGGKWICGVQTLLQRKDCIVYSFGSDGETSFEEGILRDTPCSVHVFDPTLSAEQEWKVEQVPGIKFYRYGLGTIDGIYRSNNLGTMDRSVPMFPVKKLDTIMKELGHSWIDVLKLDIEGSEWSVLEQLLTSSMPLPFTQLQVELHHWRGKERTPPRTMLRILRDLTNKGHLRAFNVEPNIWWVNNGHDFVEYAFIQVDSQGDIVTRPEL